MRKLLPLFLALLTCSLPAISQQTLRPGSPAPVFSGTMLDGSHVDLGALRGRVVVMTFWSTRCAICHHELPKLNAMAAKHSDRDVVFLGLSMENEEKINGYVRRNPFRFQIVPNSFGTVLQYADRDGVGNIDMGFPAYFVVDRDGVIRHRSSGYDKTGGVDSAIVKLSGK